MACSRVNFAFYILQKTELYKCHVTRAACVYRRAIDFDWLLPLVRSQSTRQLWWQRHLARRGLWVHAHEWRPERLALHCESSLHLRTGTVVGEQVNLRNTAQHSAFL
jgi:hypothetical protein